MDGLIFRSNFEVLLSLLAWWHVSPREWPTPRLSFLWAPFQTSTRHSLRLSLGSGSNKDPRTPSPNTLREGVMYSFRSNKIVTMRVSPSFGTWAGQCKASLCMMSPFESPYICSFHSGGDVGEGVLGAIEDRPGEANKRGKTEVCGIRTHDVIKMGPSIWMWMLLIYVHVQKIIAINEDEAIDHHTLGNFVSSCALSTY